MENMGDLVGFIDTSIESRVNYVSSSYDFNEYGTFDSKRTLIQIKKGNEYSSLRVGEKDLECILKNFGLKHADDLIGKQVTPLYEDKRRRNLIGILPFMG